MKNKKRNICKSKTKKSEQLRKYNSAKKDKKALKDQKIKVTVDLRRGQVQTSNTNGEKYSIKFRGFVDNGSFSKIYNRHEIHALQREIFVKYQEKNGRLPKKQQESLKKLIKQNIDTSIYKSLKNYDINNFGETSKSIDYINAMLKKVPRRKYESDKDYKKRVVQERNKLLKNAGIKLEYDLTGMLFNKNNLLDNIKILHDAFKMKTFSTMKLFNSRANKNMFTKPKSQDINFEPIKSKVTNNKKESFINNSETEIDFEPISVKDKNIKSSILQFDNDEGINFEPIHSTQNKRIVKSTPNTKNLKFEAIEYENPKAKSSIPDGIIEFEPVYSKTKKASIKSKPQKYSSPKSLIYSLREKTKKPGYIAKTLRVATFIGLSFLTFSRFSINATTAENNEYVEPNAETNIEIANDRQTINDVLNENRIINKNINKVIIEDINECNNEQEESDIETIIDENEESHEEMVNMNDALIEALGLGIDSECTITEGRYYSSADKQGKFGNYKNINAPVKINYIVAIENGTYFKYDLTDGKTIADIKKEHPNAEISYHMVTSGGMILGWNDSTENNIETQLVKNALMNIKDYLSPETMQFLCDNELSSSIDKNQCLEHLDEVQNAMAQYEQSLQNSQEDIEL